MIMALFMRPCRMASEACPRKGTPEVDAPLGVGETGDAVLGHEIPLSWPSPAVLFITARAAIILKLAAGTSPAPAGK